MNRVLQLVEFGDDLKRWPVPAPVVDDFLVPVEGQVVALSGDVVLGYAETLLGALALPLGTVALGPAG